MFLERKIISALKIDEFWYCINNYLEKKKKKTNNAIFPPQSCNFISKKGHSGVFFAFLNKKDLDYWRNSVIHVNFRRGLNIKLLNKYLLNLTTVLGILRDFVNMITEGFFFFFAMM